MPIAWFLPTTTYQQLTVTGDADAVHDVFVDLLVEQRIVADPHHAGLLITDHHARNAGHAQARFRIAIRHRRLNQMRSHHRDTNRADRYTNTNPGQTNDPADFNLAAAETSELHAALALLPERDRQALTARYIDDLDYPELATRLDTTVANARQITHRAQQRLKDILTTNTHAGALR